MSFSQASYLIQTQFSSDDHRLDDDRYLTTPKDHNDNIRLFNAVVNIDQSPKRKKREAESFYDTTLPPPPVFSSQLSQSAPGDSNFQLRVPVPTGMYSQDDNNFNSQTDYFVDRFGRQLSVQSAYEDSRVDVNTNSNISHLCYDNQDLMSNDGFQASQCVLSQPPPLTAHKDAFQVFPKHKPAGVGIADTKFNKENQGRKNGNIAMPELEPREIKVAPPVQNPFLAPEARAAKIGPRSLWVEPYVERSRYFTDFHQEGVVGQGVSSNVYCARNRMDGTAYAVKRLHAPVSVDTDKRQVQKEVCALAALLGCPYIIQYFNSWIDDGHLYIQTELCALGTLDSLVEHSDDRLHGAFAASHLSRANSFEQSGISSRPSSFFSHFNSQGSHSQTSVSRPLSLSQDSSVMQVSENESSSGPSLTELTVWTVLSRMATALSFMHRRGIAHMDIRPANMFIASNTHFVDSSSAVTNQSTSSGGFPNPQPLHRQKSVNLNVPADKLKRMIVNEECAIKLGDFGLARRLDENKPDTIEEGETRYCARELVNGNGPIDLKAVDVFSLGASGYEIMLGRELGVSGEVGSVEWHSIRDGHLDEDLVASGLFSSDLFSLVKRMVDPNPQARPSAQEVAQLANSFLSSQPRAV